ncbi:MAG TPA: hypothetical protein VF261_00870 [Candidatus Saccharimonadales bacterium]
MPPKTISPEQIQQLAPGQEVRAPEELYAEYGNLQRRLDSVNRSATEGQRYLVAAKRERTDTLLDPTHFEELDRRNAAFNVHVVHEVLVRADVRRRNLDEKIGDNIRSARKAAPNYIEQAVAEAPKNKGLNLSRYGKQE